MVYHTASADFIHRISDPAGTGGIENGYPTLYIGFVPNTQNHGKWTFSIEENGRNPAGPHPLYT